MVIFVPFVQGSSCQSGVMNTIRQVHMGVREAGRLADEEIAPRLENYGDTCIERADEAGFPAGSGSEGMNYWRECMSTYMQLEVAVSSLRTSLEELENIYEDIEAGRSDKSNWERIASRVLDHGRTVLRLCEELGVDIPDGMVEKLDGLCSIIACEERL